MLFYLSVPLVITVFRLRDRSSLWRTGFFLMVAVIIATYCTVFGGPIRLIMFVSGIVLHEAINSRRLPTPSSLFGLAALALGLLATLVPMAGYGGLTLKISALFASFFVLCLACFRDSSGWLPRAFSWTPLRWLGNMSYSYFLLHGLALKAAFLALATVLPAADHGVWFFWLLLPAMFSLTLIPSAMLFVAIERPFSLSPRRTAPSLRAEY
jgi:peptidoglycan/LPS O-acetylase OafA/YrhL